MNIATKQKIVGMTALSVIGVITLAIWWAQSEVKDANRQRNTAVAITKSLSQLRLVTLEYGIEHNERALAQWRLASVRVDLLIAHSRFSGEAQLAIVNELQERREKIRNGMNELAVSAETGKGDDSDNALALRYRSQLLSQVLLRQQDSLSDAFNLTSLTVSRIENTQQRVLTIILTGLALIALITIGTSWLVKHDVLGPIARLQQATREVAAGNRDFRLGIGSDDEIGDLSRSFTDMTTKLDAAYGTLEAEVNEHKHTEKVLQRTNASLENAILVKDSFLANMSHELRTPLNGIIGFSEFLYDQKPGPLNVQQREYLNDMLNSSRHLLQLINDVLDLAKVGSGRMEFHPENFPVQKAIDEVCAVIKPIAHKKNARINAQIDPALGNVTLDLQKFKQVLFNLLSNAIKFSNENCTVDVSASPDSARCFTLSVKDSGIGIREEHLSRLFREFEQIDAGVNRQFEGTGLGLALTRKLIELQGGTIAVASVFGKGSTFTVVLPLSTEPVPA